MKILQIRIKSREQASFEFAAAFKAVQAGSRVSEKSGVYSTSLEAVRALLTEKRLALLHLAREHSPESIYGLAKLARRDFKNVYADVMLLKKCGLIELGSPKKSGARGERQVSVPYHAINIQAQI